jgi:hypothetical protein
MKRKGDFIRTFSGIDFWPFDPRTNEIDIVDIAHALSNICRFGGHCRKFYSVAQHSVHVSTVLEMERFNWTKFKTESLIGLLHDAPEAYIGDMVTPVKKHLRSFKKVDSGIWSAIALKFKLPGYIPFNVHAADVVAIRTEVRDLINGDPAWVKNRPYCDFEPDKKKIIPVSPAEAKSMFLRRYFELMS